MSSFYVYQTVEVFHADGYELTILDATTQYDDCGICCKPIYKTECDKDATSHDHHLCSSEQNSASALAPTMDPLDEYPGPGLKIKACGHVMGQRCALKWFEQANSCPFCRVRLFPHEKDWKEEHAVRIEEIERLIAEDEAQGDRPVTAAAAWAAAWFE
jgi:hypothetical protein